MKPSNELFLVINALLRQFRLFESYCILAQKSTQTAENEAIGLGINRKGINFKDKFLFKNARVNYTINEINNIIKLLLNADIEIRGDNNPELYLELLVYKIIKNKGTVNNLKLDTIEL